MDEVMRDSLEEHLSGTLGGKRKARWESYLANHPKAAEQLRLFEDSAELLQEFRVPEANAIEPAPGFYSRVMQRIEEERGVPFWMVFLQPAFVRQMVFASLMWFALLGAYAVAFESHDENHRRAENILTEEPSPEYSVRLGTNLDQNRSSMMAVLMASGNRE